MLIKNHGKYLKEIPTGNADFLLLKNIKLFNNYRKSLVFPFGQIQE
jgi:hypothetical protein